jgi:hypothetical protein
MSNLEDYYYEERALGYLGNYVADEDEAGLNECGLISSKQRNDISCVVNAARYGDCACQILNGSGGGGSGSVTDESSEGGSDCDDYYSDESTDDGGAFWDISYRLRSHWRYCSQETSDTEADGGLRRKSRRAAMASAATETATATVAAAAVAVAGLVV